MGSFYSNYTVRSTDVAALKNSLKGRVAAITPPQNGCVVVFDQLSEAADPTTVAPFVQQLSKDLDCAVLATFVYDSDLLIMNLCNRSELIGFYCSNAEAAEEGGFHPSMDADGLCAAFGSSDTAKVDRILSVSMGDENAYVFEDDRHAAIVQALGLSTFAVGGSYNYATDGDMPNGLDESQLSRTC
jgi:hypothetical protein